MSIVKDQTPRPSRKLFGLGIGPEKLRLRLAAGEKLRLIDLRSIPARERDGHIPGSSFIPLADLRRRLAAAPEPEQPLVLICNHGIRSRLAALLAPATAPVYSLQGGIKAWKKRGFELIGAAGS
jgi:rhodanese-related sulfurtransferase